MQLALCPEIQRYIDEQVKTGHFASPEAVIEAAIRDMRDNSRDEISDEPIIEFRNVDLDEIDPDDRAAIDEAQAQFERGEVIPFEQVRADWEKRLRGA